MRSSSSVSVGSAPGGDVSSASAQAAQQSMRYDGLFVVAAETRGDATPADLEAALLDELERLANEPVPPEELQKVKNQTMAASFRNLQSPFFLLVQLLFYDGFGNWRYLNTWSERTLAVTAEDVQRVAKRYFTKENRTVATYLRKAGTASESVPPELAGGPRPLLPGPEIHGEQGARPAAPRHGHGDQRYVLRAWPPAQDADGVEMSGLARPGRLAAVVVVDQQTARAPVVHGRVGQRLEAARPPAAAWDSRLPASWWLRRWACRFCCSSAPACSSAACATPATSTRGSTPTMCW